MKKIISLVAVVIIVAACKKNSPTPPAVMSDIDGNVYATVKIGNQLWMKENLKTTRYRNGDAIPRQTYFDIMSASTSGGWCWYNNDSTTYSGTYGRLYNWYAVNDPRGLAPQGWHVPTDEEWATLSASLGGDAAAGGVMKETGTIHWRTPNEGATNTSDFTGLPSGFRQSDGTFWYIGLQGNWWSSTESNRTFAWKFDLIYTSTDLTRDGNPKQTANSVRCLRD